MHNKYLFLYIYLIVTLHAQASLMHTDINTEEVIYFLVNNQASPLKNIIQDIASTYSNPNDLLVDFFKNTHWHYISHENKTLTLETPETNNLHQLVEFKWPNAFLDFSFKQLCLSCMINDNRINDQPSEFELFLYTQSKKAIITFLLNYNSLISPNKMHIAQSYLIAKMCADFAKKNSSCHLYKALMAAILFHNNEKTFILDIQPITLLIVDLLHNKYPFFTKQFFLENWEKTIQAMVYQYFYRYDIHDSNYLDENLYKKPDIKSILDITVPLPPFAKIKILNGHLDLSGYCLNDKIILPKIILNGHFYFSAFRCYSRSTSSLIDYEKTVYHQTSNLINGCGGPAVFSYTSYLIIPEVTKLTLYDNPLLTSKHIYKLMHAFPNLKTINIDQTLFEDMQENMPKQHKHILLNTKGLYYDYKYNCQMALQYLGNPSPLIIQCKNEQKNLKSIYKDIYKYYLLETNIFDDLILRERSYLIIQFLGFLLSYTLPKVITTEVSQLIFTYIFTFIPALLRAFDPPGTNYKKTESPPYPSKEVMAWLLTKLFIISFNIACIINFNKKYHTNDETYLAINVLLTTISINYIYWSTSSYKVDLFAAFAIKELYFKKEPFACSKNGAI